MSEPVIDDKGKRAFALYRAIQRAVEGSLPVVVSDDERATLREIHRALRPKIHEMAERLRKGGG